MKSTLKSPAVIRFSWLLAMLLWLPSSTLLAQGFTEVSQAIGITHFFGTNDLMGGGIGILDYDNDGWEDLYLTGGTNPDRLFRNLGNGNFMDVSAAAGISAISAVNTMGVVTGDINNDGYREIYVTTSKTEQNILLFNNGNGTFTDITLGSGTSSPAVFSTSATMGDVNLDGLLDIYVQNYVDVPHALTDSTGGIVGFAHECSANYFYLNLGNNTFQEVAGQFGIADTGCGLAVTFSDYDGDKDADLFVVNDFGQWVQPNQLHRNEQPQVPFSNQSAASNADVQLYGMGVAIGDYDEDGDFDYYFTNLGRNVLLRNEGNGTFFDVTDSAGVANDSIYGGNSVSWGTFFFDYDNDTYLDLYVANGHIPSADFIANPAQQPNVFYKGDGTGNFVEQAAALGIADTAINRGTVMFDYDHDGDLDIVVARLDQWGLKRTKVFRNDLSNGSNWLAVKPIGVAANRDSYGARVRIVAGGRTFIREIDGGSSFLSQSSSIAHFGLGSYAIVDTLEVCWPGGDTVMLQNIAVNQLLEVPQSCQLVETMQFDICAGDTVLGTIFQADSMWNDTLVTSTGCDSITVWTVDVRGPENTVINDTICAGNSSGAFLWSDTSWVEILTNTTGCDSVVTGNFVVVPPLVATIDTALCPGATWHGIEWQSDSTFIDTIYTAQGCAQITNNSVTMLAASDPECEPIGTQLNRKVNLPELRIYPNPASQSVMLVLPENSGTIEAFDLTGRRVFSAQAQTIRMTVDLSAWSPGSYLITYKTLTGVHRSMLVRSY